MSILTGKQVLKPYIKKATGYIKSLLSSQHVEMNDGKTLQTAFDEINNNLMHQYILYDNPSPRLDVGIRMSASAADFDMLTIMFVTNDGEYSSVNVWNPNSKLVNLSTVTYVGTLGSVYVKAKTVKIDGTLIDTYFNGGYWCGEVQAEGANSPNRVDTIGISQVIGWK